MAKVYVAGPLFTMGERWLLERVEAILRKHGFQTYLPHREASTLPSLQAVYQSHVKALRECDLMVAVLDGPDVDSGTAFEAGYFKALGKPVVGLRTDWRALHLPRRGETPEVNIMLRFSLDAYVRSLEELDGALRGLKV